VSCLFDVIGDYFSIFFQLCRSGVFREKRERERVFEWCMKCLLFNLSNLYNQHHNQHFGAISNGTT